MVSELRLMDDARFELALEFRYKDVRASYAELAAGLDRNQDGALTRQEVKLRFLDIVDPLALAITITVNGKPVTLEADPARFELRDLNNDKANFDGPEGAPTHSMRILYRFVFSARPDPGRGAHQVEYIVSGPQAVVHTPKDQMLVVDARAGTSAVAEARWDTKMGGIPRVQFLWQVGPPTPPEASPTPTGGPNPAPHTEAEPENIRGLGEVPAWLTLVAGAMLALVGMALVVRRAIDAGRKGRLSNALLLIFAGAAIVLGALMRLGIIGKL